MFSIVLFIQIVVLFLDIISSQNSTAIYNKQKRVAFSNESWDIRRRQWEKSTSPDNTTAWWEGSDQGVEVNRMILEGEEVVFRVVKGREANLGDVPYQISFRKRRGNSKIYASFCGGTLITTTEIISAAHCFHKKKMCDFCCNPGKASKDDLIGTYAVAGCTQTFTYLHQKDTVSWGEWRQINNVFYSKSYNFPDHDFAVVFIAQPMIITANIEPIGYAKVDMEYHGTCLLSGFGRTSGELSSRYLRMADLRVLPKAQCSRLHRKAMDRFICTSDEVSDVGKGDSGGPLVCKGTGDPNEGPRGVLVGIVCGKHRRMSMSTFFVRMSSYTKVLDDAYKRNGYENTAKISRFFFIIGILIVVL